MQITAEILLKRRASLDRQLSQHLTLADQARGAIAALDSLMEKLAEPEPPAAKLKSPAGAGVDEGSSQP